MKPEPRTGTRETSGHKLAWRKITEVLDTNLLESLSSVLRVRIPITSTVDKKSELYPHPFTLSILNSFIFLVSIYEAKFGFSLNEPLTRAGHFA